jgi:hypothetical protein
MRKKLNEPVSIIAYYGKKYKCVPYSMRWQNKNWIFEMDGFYHKRREGSAVMHIYELVEQDRKFAFRLRFNAKDLSWTLETISDGLPT